MGDGENSHKATQDGIGKAGYYYRVAGSAAPWEKRCGEDEGQTRTRQGRAHAKALYL